MFSCSFRRKQPTNPQVHLYCLKYPGFSALLIVRKAKRKEKQSLFSCVFSKYSSHYQSIVVKDRYIGHGEARLKAQKLFLLMRFVIYKGIIISVFCKGTFMTGALCKTPFSHSFAECDLSEKCSPIPEGLRLLRHGTHCSSAGRSSADGGAFQLTLDTKSNWHHLHQEVTTLFGLECPLLFIMCIFYSASKMFPYWLLPFALWCEQLVCEAEQEQQ